MKYPKKLLFFDIILLALLTAFTCGYFRPELLFLDTIVSGGDTASHFYTAKYLTGELLPRGEISGWCMGNLAGFPMLQYYFPLPFLAIAALNSFLPLTVAFKLGTVLGVFLLPLCTYGFFRQMRRPFPVPVAGAAFSMAFLFMGGNSMWGGNARSMLAGEFCYSVGFALAVLWLGVVFRRVREGRGAAWPALFLAVVGLCHAYALLFAGVGTAFFLLTRKRFSQNIARLFRIHVLGFCFLGFWIIPLLYNLPMTTRFNILWVFPTFREALAQIFPVMILPFMGLALLTLAAACVRRFLPGRERTPFRDSPLAYISFLSAAGLALYFAGYRGRVVDVRFLPFFQFFLVIAGAEAFSFLPRATPARIRGLAAAALAVGVLFWVDGNAGTLGSWIRHSYQGFEKARLWPAFRDVNRFLSGGPADPRVVYEHSPLNQRAGTVRAFENLPLFSGRSTLEGVYIQASAPVPYIFYIQSEISQKPSTPIPDYFYSRFNPDRALEHLKLFNVNQLIAAETKTREALDTRSDLAFQFEAGPWAIYKIKDAPERYVEPLVNRPALLPLKNWRDAAYTWFRMGDLNVIPVFCDDPAPRDRDRMAPADPADPAKLPQKPMDGQAPAGLSETLRQEEILIQNAVPGRPLLVKVSYHRGWKSLTGERVYLAGPGFMLLFPKGPTVHLVYGPTGANRAGLVLTLFAALLSLAAWKGPLAGPIDRAAAFMDRKGAILLGPVLAAILILTAVYLGPLGPEYPVTPFNKAIAQFTRGDYNAAEAGFRRVLNEHPRTLISGEAAYHLAMGRFRQEDYKGTLEALDEMLAAYPDSTRAAEAWYHKGLCRLKMGRKEASVADFKAVREKFPDSIWAGFAADRLKELGAWEYQKQG